MGLVLCLSCVSLDLWCLVWNLTLGDTQNYLWNKVMNLLVAWWPASCLLALYRTTEEISHDSPTSGAVCCWWCKFAPARMTPRFFLTRQVCRGIGRHCLVYPLHPALCPQQLGGSSPSSSGSTQRLLRQPKAGLMPQHVECESLLSRTRGSLPEQCGGQKTAAEHCRAKQKASLLLALYLTCG